MRAYFNLLKATSSNLSVARWLKTRLSHVRSTWFLPPNILRGISKFIAPRLSEFQPIFSTRFLYLWCRFWAFMDRTERHTNYPNLFRSTSLIHYLLVIFHWNGCLYHIIYKNNGFGSKNWVFSDSETADVVKQYLQSYYWCTLALTTIGDLPRYLLIYLYADVTCKYIIWIAQENFALQISLTYWDQIFLNARKAT